MQRALLVALLEPREQLAALERAADYTGRLALQEALKGLPAGAVWDQFCLQHDLPLDTAYMGEIRAYETEVLAKR
jgi:L-rhamnose isomerase